MFLLAKEVWWIKCGKAVFGTTRFTERKISYNYTSFECRSEWLECPLTLSKGKIQRERVVHLRGGKVRQTGEQNTLIILNIYIFLIFVYIYIYIYKCKTNQCLESVQIIAADNSNSANTFVIQAINFFF